MNGFVQLIALDVTSRCNLRCAHCYNASGGSGESDLNHEEMLRLAAEIADLKPGAVCLCGGEPLLVDSIIEMMDVMKGKTSGINMVSNGLLMTNTMAETLKAHGLKAIQISLDGAFAWQHDSLRGRAGSFDAAIRAIHALKEAGIHQVSVSMIPNRLNYCTVEEYFRLCASLGISILKFMPFMPLGRGSGEGRNLILKEKEMFCFQRQLSRMKGVYAEAMHVEWDDPVRSARTLCEKILRGEPPYSICIAANGDVRTDIYAPVLLGNIRERTLEELLRDGLREAIEQGRFQKVLKDLHEINDLGR